MKIFLKKYWLMIFLAFLSSLIVGIFFIAKEKKTGNEIPLKQLTLIPPVKFKEHQLKNPNISFNSLYKNFAELPKEGIVYEIKNPFFSEEESTEIATTLGFNETPNFIDDEENNISYEWNELEKNITIKLNKGEINFINKNPQPEAPLTSLPDISKIDSLAKEIIKERGFPINTENFVLKEKSYVESYGFEYGQTKNRDQAFAIEAVFEYDLDDVRFSGSGLNILIGDKNEILKLDYKLSFKEINILETYPLKDKQEIIKIVDSLNLNFINYFQIINDYELSGNPEDIRNIDFNKIELIYIKSEVPQSYLQPIFFISGQGILRDGRVVEVGIYLPAIKDEYLLK